MASLSHVLPSTLLLPAKTHVRIISGRYKDRQGQTSGPRREDGFYEVCLTHTETAKMEVRLFSAGQLEPLWNANSNQGPVADLTDITVFDFETNGTNPHLNQVIEVAAVRYINLEPVAMLNALVHCPEPLPAKITELTGITSEMARAATMPERTALAMLRNLAGDSTLVAHNAAFDMSFLHFGCKRLGATQPLNNPFLCTLTVARTRYEFPHTLSNLCLRLAIDTTGAHRALQDVQMCFELMKAMHTARPCMDLMNTIGYPTKYGPPMWAPAYANLIAQ